MSKSDIKLRTVRVISLPARIDLFRNLLLQVATCATPTTTTTSTHDETVQFQ